jgi:hypothetical protein
MGLGYFVLDYAHEGVIVLACVSETSIVVLITLTMKSVAFLLLTDCRPTPLSATLFSVSKTSAPVVSRSRLLLTILDKVNQLKPVTDASSLQHTSQLVLKSSVILVLSTPLIITS